MKTIALSLKRGVQYYVPVTLLLFLSVTIERIVVTDGGYDTLYGFPFAFRSNAFTCSFCYEVYISTLLSNLAVDFALVYGIFKGVKRVGFKIKLHKILYFVSALVILFAFIDFYLLFTDSFVKWSNDTKFRLVRSEFKFSLP